MAKTQEELKQLKQEYESLNSRLNELTEDKLNIVIGGVERNYLNSIFLPGKHANAGGVGTSTNESIIVGPILEKFDKIHDIYETFNDSRLK